MVKLTFDFDEKELSESRVTKDDILAYARNMALKHDISETSYGVFEKDGKDAVALLAMMGVESLRTNLEYLKYVKRVELDDEGDIDDCKESVEEWLEERGGVMVKLTFDFDKEKLLERGLTEDGMLEEVREFAKENGIEEIAYGVSEKSGA